MVDIVRLNELHVAGHEYVLKQDCTKTDCEVHQKKAGKYSEE